VPILGSRKKLWPRSTHHILCKQ